MPFERRVGTVGRAVAAVVALATTACNDTHPNDHDAPDAAEAADAEAGADVDPPRPALLDDAGRTVIYVGVNVGQTSKEPPDFMPGLSDGDYDLLVAWGVTLVRFLVFWEAIEPEPGVHDEAYLAAVRAEIDRIGARGIDVAIDMHQDVFGRGFGFAGAPRWACLERHYATFLRTEPWFINYLAPEVTACFDHLWGSSDLWERYRDSWVRAARALGDHPAVIGFDLMNEPAPGSATAAAFERDVLSAFYDLVGAGATAAAPGRLLLLEPSLLVNLGARTRLPPFGSGEVYAPHYYPAFTETGGYDGRADAVRAGLGELAADAARLGAPLVIGEFGIRNDAAGAERYVADALDAALELGASALAWDMSRGGPGSFSLLDADGRPHPTAGAFARPYPHRVAGRLVSSSYDRPSGALEIAWEESGAAGPTVVVLPPALFPSVRVTSSDPPGSWTHEHDAVRGRLVLAVDPFVTPHRFRFERP
ncbi:MAG: cellulase family glycosylhydrolase [Myxococcota bacterium]|nr:cellulase family glycosylhydrolase [Myxococcota bacterium]